MTDGELISLWWWRFWSTLYPWWLLRFIAAFLYAFPKRIQGAVFKLQLIEELYPEKLDPALNAWWINSARLLRDNESHYSKSAGLLFNCQPCYLLCECRFMQQWLDCAVRIISGLTTVVELRTFLNYVNQYTKPFCTTSRSCLTSKCLVRAERTAADQDEIEENGHQFWNVEC